ncbi:MAG: P-loop NTPase, partial [Desulfobacteraceae bacterium]
MNVPHKKPEIWAVGGGKGGVGKSLVSALLALDMAGRGNKTILIDVDLGGANLHTMMGIKTPPRTLNDLVMRKYETMDQICIQTGIRNLQIVCGASEILSLANPQYAQKHKIVQNIVGLRADCVILDLGAGTSYNVLDFFLIADHPIVVLTPQPISIQNAYGFVRNTVYRKLSRLAAQQPSLQNVIKAAMDPKNDRQMRTIHDLFESIST